MVSTNKKEIERKFLIEREQFEELKSGYESKDISQAYLVVSEDREVRLRTIRDDGVHLLTIKSSGNLSRQEFEIKLSNQQFEEFEPLWENDDASVHKTRYYIPHGKLTIEVDEYRKNLKGLVVAEVEFKDRKSAEDFEAPCWFGQEITSEDKYKNKNLAGKHYQDI